MALHNPPTGIKRWLTEKAIAAIMGKKVLTKDDYAQVARMHKYLRLGHSHY